LEEFGDGGGVGAMPVHPDAERFDPSQGQPAIERAGNGAAGILMQPDGARAFVACTPDDYVTIINLKTLEVAGHIEAGKQPDGLAWAVRR
jgi:YVTN family beta-propeller protein